MQGRLQHLREAFYYITSCDHMPCQPPPPLLAEGGSNEPNKHALNLPLCIDHFLLQFMTYQLPDPDPPKRVVEDSQSPTGTMEMPVLDSECLYATKLLCPIFNDPSIVTTRRRFEQECHFLTDMKHPHIAQYLGTSHDPNSSLVVLLMEIVVECLINHPERCQKPLTCHIKVKLCRDIAKALAYLHSKEIINRDLSGNNALLLDGRSKITVFGMSKLLDSNCRMMPLTMCPGTLAYMPPEALRVPPVYSKKIDCFSFGVLQIQIMTRQFPDPGPPKRVVENSRSPTGTLEIPVLDSKCHKFHIDLINPTHTVLQTALDCLKKDLCRQQATFNEAHHKCKGYG